MNCPFYGRHPFRTGLMDSGGNQCAIIADSYAPCVMEVSLKETPDYLTCELLKQARLCRSVIEEACRGLPEREPS
jgi:hypothetical protein